MCRFNIASVENRRPKNPERTPRVNHFVLLVWANGEPQRGSFKNALTEIGRRFSPVSLCAGPVLQDITVRDVQALPQRQRT